MCVTCQCEGGRYSAYQGRGLGGLLLLHSLKTLYSASQSVGFQMVVVHAIDESAAAFYEKYGFSRFADNPLYLYLTTRDLRATFSNADLG